VEHRFRNRDCLVDGHPCMTDLSPNRVLGALSRALGIN
jgi:hypothetical protein